MHSISWDSSWCWSSLPVQKYVTHYFEVKSFSSTLSSLLEQIMKESFQKMHWSSIHLIFFPLSSKIQQASKEDCRMEQCWLFRENISPVKHVTYFPTFKFPRKHLIVPKLWLSFSVEGTVKAQAIWTEQLFSLSKLVLRDILPCPCNTTHYMLVYSIKSSWILVVERCLW